MYRIDCFCVKVMNILRYEQNICSKRTKITGKSPNTCLIKFGVNEIILVSTDQR